LVGCLVAGQHLAAYGQKIRKPKATGLRATAAEKGQSRASARTGESIMANDAFMKTEVPDSFRDLMKVSIEQAKRAFDTFAATSEKTWKTFETSSRTVSSGLRSLNEKIAEITRSNAEANFALAMKLAESKDVGQAMELQTEHARKQMESFVHQLEEIRDLAAQVIQDSTPSGMPGNGG
jgi:phasin